MTEPDLPKIEGKLLRAFPDELPADELNTKIDEVFVPAATNALPQTAAEFQSWRGAKLSELRRIVFRREAEAPVSQAGLKLNRRQAEKGSLRTEPGVNIPWNYLPATNAKSDRALWLVVLGEDESPDSRPEWLTKVAGDAATFLVAPRGSGPLRWPDPPPYYIQRSLPLLGRTVDSCRLADVLAAAAHVLQAKRVDASQVKIIGRGSAGVIAAYAALLEPRLSEVIVIDPPVSHRDGPVFLNVLRVLDVPEAFGLLAPRPLTLWTSSSGAFDATTEIYRSAGGRLQIRPRP